MVTRRVKISRARTRSWSRRHRRTETADGSLAQGHGVDLPIGAELLSDEQLRRHARTLASWHRLAEAPPNDRLLRRLKDNARVLEEAYRMLSREAAESCDIPPGGVWLLDNYYVIHDQIHMTRLHLPRKYSRELPQLAGGDADGLPRVYDLARELIRHVDGQIDEENVHEFIGAYQEGTHLKLGELWAIPTMLRLALIENLRRVALRIAGQQHDRQLGQFWAERTAEASHEGFGLFLRTVSELVARQPALSSAFVARFTRALNGRLPKDNAAVQWLSQQLADRGQTVENLVELDDQNQAADQLSMANTISSLRALGAMDWKEFVESQSVVDRILRDDPAGFYEQMDFTSRDRYRHAVEGLARRSGLSEEQVARLAVEQARSGGARPADEESTTPRGRTRRDHVGYYLVERGRPALERTIGYRRTWREILSRRAAGIPLAGYLGAVLLVWLSILGGGLVAAASFGASAAVGPGAGLVLAVLFAGAAGQLAVNLVNWACTLIVPPRSIMRLDFSKGIPAEHRTLVAVPTMLTGETALGRLIDQLETRYLANQDENLLFALVTDFPDADQPTLPGDQRLIDLASREIQRLNRQYRGRRPPTFFLLHRPRKFNRQEGVWMGEERKRGKLAALNRLIRTGATDAFHVVTGDPALLASVRYVITLDTDTDLPHTAAWKLVGCMAHPLNRPRIDSQSRTVVDGHAILQPRVSTTIPEATRTPFSRLFAGDAGIDPYTMQTSDVYQDVFDQGSFIGKGIYDVYAFEAALERRFPDNRVLSHDLIEGCFARSGLVSDVELFEGFPSRLLADMSRRHRWTRGDWQIAAWLRRRVPSERGVGLNPLSWLSRWKIFDNLRRTLHPVFLLAFLALGWTLSPSMAILWTLLALAIVFGAVLIGGLPGLMRKPEETPWSLHLKDQGEAILSGLAREAIGLAILPYTVHCNLDATVRALYRLHVSRRKLLEWTTASDAEVRAGGGCRDHYEIMCASTVVSLAVAGVLAVLNPFALAAAGPVLLAWLLGPAIAWRISQPDRHEAIRLNAEQAQHLRRWARQTWHYFESHVTRASHWLPPDNVRHQAEWSAAPRTSPTNLGMGLLSELTAVDLGYQPATALLTRLGRTLDTLGRLERYHGHFYNWYDTRTLEPAEPRYVSSVDSGNLWGALVVLESGIRESRDQPIVSPRLFEGIQDTLSVVAAIHAGTGHRSPPFEAGLADLQGAVASEGDGARETLDRLGRIGRQAVGLRADAGPDRPELRQWTRALVQQIVAFRRHVARLAFWAHGGPPPADAVTRVAPEIRQDVEDLLVDLEKLDAGCTLAEISEAAREIRDRAGDLLARLPCRSEAVARLVPCRTVSGEGLPDAEEDFDLLSTGHRQPDGEPDAGQELGAWLESLGERARRAGAFADGLLGTAAGLADLCEQFAAMDFRFLFHPKRKLLAIGFNVAEHRPDNSYYDLFASEARLASFLGVCFGQFSQEHWFALGRMVTSGGGEPALLSWSGSMFEYLMPMLVMPSYRGTLLEASCRAAVRRQIQYGRRRGVPWGISESSYYVTDAGRDYRYRAFGVPGLGIQRGLGKHLVVAPYASALAAMIAPHEARNNLERLERLGCLSTYGFYDAIDYTPGRRLPDGQPAICRTVMAHHSGMTLLALAKVLLAGPMQRRFLENRRCRAYDLLLQERVPQAIRPVDPNLLDMGPASLEAGEASRANLRIFDTPHTAVPEVHLLSNGEYHVMLTAAGGGMSRWNRWDVTRWHDDVTRDHFGQFCYLRDLETGAYWSSTYQPTRRSPDKYQAVFSQGQVEYRVVSEEIDARTQVSVSPEDNLEVRRLSITNLARLERSIELTTYGEVVLAPAESDRAHRAFSSLFVETEILPELDAILCTRRPRSADETPPWMFHLIHIQAGRKSPTEFETSRERFVGRTRSPENPLALESSEPLAASSGAVLDPVVSIRQTVTLAGDEAAVVHVITGIAATRAEAIAAVERYRDPRLAARVFELSRARSQLTLQHLNLTESDAQLYSHLAASLLFADARYRVRPAIVGQHLRRQDALWPLGISGDRPIVLVRCTSERGMHLVRQMLGAHAYWRGKGIEADLVLWVESETGYRQTLVDQVTGTVASGPSAALADQPGGVFVRRSDQYTDDDYFALSAAARIHFSDAAGPLEEQVKHSRPVDLSPPPNSTRPAATRRLGDAAERVAPDLALFNGVGGFTRDGREYISVVTPDRPTPAPWCNLLANPDFGTVVSESGTGYTWSENSHEFRLTPWSNDPICDPSGEVVYLHDEESDELVSATPLPAPSPRGYTCRHGFGYTVWETSIGELDSQLCVFVSIDRPVKFFLLTLKNRSARRRKLTATCVVEWVLGEHRGKTAPFVVTEVDPRSGALVARNPFHLNFGERVAFLHAGESRRSVTCDRTEVLGRNGSWASPAGLRRPNLHGRAGAGLDPAAAIRCEVELAAGEQRELVFVLGAATGVRDACDMAQHFAGLAAARQELSRVWQLWNDTLGAVHVETPEPSLNYLANGWLLYQTLACRFWGRSGFYQSGGAFGFRDQLQDAMALLCAAPHLVRQHLLRCASRQFHEGDVQHWWHPPTGRGVRTRIADDYLWLPLAASKYVRTTGDWDVLDVRIPFLIERRLEPGEEEAYTRPEASEETASLYEHCCLAIRRGLRSGSHGLPLMGTGDWNDGMNRVGAGGEGESVWLAFFLIRVLGDFRHVAEARGDGEFAELCRAEAERLAETLQSHGWDGRWYRRAYFDDGQPLGSQKNDECQIDSLPQSWSVIAGSSTPERLRAAMQSVDDRLVRRDLRLIQLLDPPFDATGLEPGYIKGYPPGVRENGGQYTHAAVWTVLAFALMGDSERAWECFRMINPANRTASPEAVAAYRAEPYVMAADVYSMPPHEGRGGWTWYTGSAGWMLQLILETLLGVVLVEGSRLVFRPCPPEDWSRYEVHYRYHQTHYRIEFLVAGRPTHHVSRVTLDGQEQQGPEILLTDDGQPHHVVVTLGT